jgi:hypothetical protein
LHQNIHNFHHPITADPKRHNCNNRAPTSLAKVRKSKWVFSMPLSSVDSGGAPRFLHLSPL